MKYRLILLTVIVLILVVFPVRSADNDSIIKEPEDPFRSNPFMENPIIDISDDPWQDQTEESSSEESGSGEITLEDNIPETSGEDQPEDREHIPEDNFLDESIQDQPEDASLEDKDSEDLTSFPDIEDISPECQEAIEEIKERGIAEGYTDGTFRPDNKINRAEFLKVVLKGADTEIPDNEYKNCFPDVGEEWFSSYVCYAREKEWVKGYADGLFHPERNISQAEGIKILILANNIKIKNTTADPWYQPYFELARNQGILTEEQDDPNCLLTRGEMSLYIWRSITPARETLTQPGGHPDNPPDEDIK